MFAGRTKELATLNRLYQTDSFQMPVIYGRRRIGKTRLITEFIRNKRAIYVQARRTNAQGNLALLSNAIIHFATATLGANYSSFDDALNAVAQLALNERLVLVIDEFPYLAESFPEISSLLQDKIDHLFKPNTKLMLVLCGSSLSFMEEQVLGYESPLYGRHTAQLKIEPLDFVTALNWWNQMPSREAALCYSFTGGVPAYMEKVDPTADAKQNIKNLFLTPSGYLYEEPANLLLQECRAPDQYDAIIQAIAAGKTRLNEIATTTGIAPSNVRTYIKKLMSIGIVSNEHPFGDKSNKKSLYRIDDGMFGFWYRFVPNTMGLVQNDMSDLAYSIIEPHLNNYMGTAFEGICRQYLYHMAREESLPMIPARVGRWWGTDPRTHSQEEIDIMADDGGANALFCECKWRQEPTGADVLRTLVNRGDLFQYDTKNYLVFSKSAFTEGCKELARQQGSTKLVTFDEMCQCK